MWIFTCIILSVMLIYHIGCGEVAVSGKCYAHAQMQCQYDLGQLWSAVVDNDKHSICLYLQNLQACLEVSMGTCGFDEHELELYEGDIVHTYTQPPYSCTLRQGKITVRRVSAHQGSSGTTRPRCAAAYLLLLLYVLLYWLRLR